MLEEWQSKSDVSVESLSPNTGRDLCTTKSGEISDLTAHYFQSASGEVVDQLRELITLIVMKDEILPESLSGLVIAGYGAKEHFAVMQEYELGEIFNNKLKYKHIGTSTINPDTPSILKPFADTEVVDTFLNSINASLELRLIEEVFKVILESPNEIIDGFPGVGKKRKEAYKKEVLPVSTDVAIRLIEHFHQYREKKFLKPILQAIEYLPKDELAHVAASLVNLSSFQKRMSVKEDETVGGPIDVAVISKGDGFVWIDRKRYFRPELNTHFFSIKDRLIVSNEGGEIHAGQIEEGTTGGG